jgi:DNA primase
MAAYLPDDFIDRLREQTDIVEVIGQYVSLKKRGKNWVGLCPFHSERTASFTVTHEKNFYKCFGCGAAGDVYTFLMEHQKLTFMQAVELLAERLGIQVPKIDISQKEDAEREKLFYANIFAAEYYHRLLVSEDEGRAALDYLMGRGLDHSLIENFQLGWAPRSRDSLKKTALQHGIEEQTLVDAGLLYPTEEGEESYDRFRARVLFPIRDIRGRTIGFGGRVLEEEHQPKYLNSPETALFHKGEILFGLDKARGTISRESKAIVVEGYMDLLSLHQHGLENVVAPLGTALTSDQARLLGRYAREVFLLYDADPAGLKATFRGGDELLGAGVNVRVITLPKGMDPDDFMRQKGLQAFHKLLEKASDFLDRKMEIISQRLDFEIVSEREKGAEKLLESVARCRNELVKNLYLKKSAEFIGVPETVMAERLNRISSRFVARAGKQLSPEKLAGGRSLRKIEFYLLALCFHHPDYIEKTIVNLGDKPFRDKKIAQAFESLAEAAGKEVRNLIEALYGSLPESLYPLIGKLKEEKTNLEPHEKVFDWCWRNLKIEQIDLQIRENFIKYDINDPELQRIQQSLRNEKLELQKNLAGAFWFGEKSIFR